jgi:hypothetical protein
MSRAIKTRLAFDALQYVSRLRLLNAFLTWLYLTIDAGK